MSFFYRALTSLKRTPKKILILFSLTFILGNLISGSISIHRAIERTKESLWMQFPTIATVREDEIATEIHFEEYGAWPLTEIPLDSLQRIGELPYVKNFDISASYRFFSRELLRYWNPNVSQNSGNNLLDGDSLKSFDIHWLENFKVRGIGRPRAVEMEYGILELVSGDYFTYDQINNHEPIALISKELAEENNLSIGSTFSLELINFNEFCWSEITEDNIVDYKELTFEVGGIFEVKNPLDRGGRFEIDDAFLNASMKNQIYVPIGVVVDGVNFLVESINENSSLEFELSDMLQYENMFALNDPREMNEFIEAAQEILPDFITVEFPSNNYMEIISAMESMSMIADFILYGAVAATLIILSLLITLALRDRKTEIGLYLALGERKWKIISQLLIEVISTSLSGILLSIFTGNLFSGRLSSIMLRNGLHEQENMRMRQRHIFIPDDTIQWFGRGDMMVQEMMDFYNTSLDGLTVAIFILTGLLVILFSTIIPIITLLRLNPKKILL